MSVSPHIWHVCMSRSVCELACVTNSATGTFYSPWGSYIHRSLPVYRLTPRLSWATLRYTHLLHLSSWHIRQCNCSWKESINKTLYFWHLVTQTFIIQNQFFLPSYSLKPRSTLKMCLIWIIPFWWRKAEGDGYMNDADCNNLLHTIALLSTLCPLPTKHNP